MLFSFLFQNLPLFHCWKADRGLKLSRHLQTAENNHLHIYSLWQEQAFCLNYGTSVLAFIKTLKIFYVINRLLTTFRFLHQIRCCPLEQDSVWTAAENRPVYDRNRHHSCLVAFVRSPQRSRLRVVSPDALVAATGNHYKSKKKKRIRSSWFAIKKSIK
jgi:hypothetical protein